MRRKASPGEACWQGGVEERRRAIEFRIPPWLAFWQHDVPDAPDDVRDVWEMDRAEAGWFLDNPLTDDWGRRQARTEKKNMEQVVGHPLEDWCGTGTRQREASSC